MVPRPDIHALPVESDLDEVMRVFATTQRSRIPVYRGTLDHVLGFVHIKDMVWILLDRERRLEENLSPSPFDLRRVLREVLIVPETKPANELLLELRTRHLGMALVVGRIWQHPWAGHHGRHPGTDGGRDSRRI